MRTTQLLNLDQLLIEMEVITKENQLSFKGGVGPDDGTSLSEIPLDGRSDGYITNYLSQAFGQPVTSTTDAMGNWMISIGNNAPIPLTFSLNEVNISNNGTVQNKYTGQNYYTGWSQWLSDGSGKGGNGMGGGGGPLDGEATKTIQGEESDLFSVSSFSSYVGLFMDKNAALMRFTAQDARLLEDIVAAEKVTKVFVTAGRLVGVAGAAYTFIDGFTDKDGMTWGKGAKVAIGLVATFTPLGWAYTVVDLSTGIITKTTLTDRIGDAIDGK